MKRFFILATAAIVALASCAKTEVVYNDAPEQIAFKQITGVMTKANLALTGTLGVIAHQNTTEHFGNTEFTLNGGVWTNADAYWPYEGKLNFTVYAPYAEDKASFTSNALTVEGVTAGPAVYYGAERYMDVEKTANAIDVVMKHMSSKITVNFSATAPYAITSVALNSVATEGDVEVDYTDQDSPVVSATPKELKALEFQYGVENYILPGDQTSFTIEFTQGNLEFTKKIVLAGTWDANTAYTYNITLSASDKITFSATVAPWDNAEAVNKDQSHLTNIE